MAGEFGGGGFLSGIAGVVAGIANFIKGFVLITAKDILRLIAFLKDQIVELSKRMLDGVFALGKALARTVRSLFRLIGSGLKRFLLWADKKLRALEQFLKAKFAPLLRRLKELKDHFDEFYKKYIRPIIDAIEFVRHVNQVLQLFHIKVLQKVDTTLAQIEARIEQPFLFIRQHITILENWINRIVTLDGLFQRITLIRSMGRHAPAWMRIATNTRTKPLTADQSYAIERAKMTASVPDIILDCRAYLDGQTSNIGPVIDEAIERALSGLRSA